jgi:tight adherence protein C
VFVAIGFMLPDVWLSRQITARQLAITNALPDALDMMTIGVEAGLSFEQAIGEIVSRWHDVLSVEFRRVLYEIGIGKSRREALEHLSERTGVPDLVSFVTAVNHSEELGTSLARVLNVQSQEMRIRRRQRAQEAANKVPIKMLFPMVFLIFPAVFAVILGPGIPRLFQALGGVTGG